MSISACHQHKHCHCTLKFPIRSTTAVYAFQIFSPATMYILISCNISYFISIKKWGFRKNWKTTCVKMISMQVIPFACRNTLNQGSQSIWKDSVLMENTYKEVVELMNVIPSKIQPVLTVGFIALTLYLCVSLGESLGKAFFYISH